MLKDTTVLPDASKSAIDEWVEPAQALPTKKETELMLRLAQLESDNKELREHIEKILKTHVKIEPVVPAELQVGDEFLIAVKLHHKGEPPIKSYYLEFNSGFNCNFDDVELINAIRIVGGQN